MMSRKQHFPGTRSYLQLRALGEGMSVFSNGLTFSLSVTFLSQPHAQNSWPTQTKLHTVIQQFLLFLLVLFCLGQRKNMKLGQWEGGEGHWRRGRISSIHCMKSSVNRLQHQGERRTHIQPYSFPRHKPTIFLDMSWETLFIIKDV